MYKEGSLRFYHIANGHIVHQQDVETPFQALILINKYAEDDLKDESIEFNAFGLEQYSEEDIDGTHWTEWYNNDGQDICEVLDELEEKLEY